mmetsp:Transcript_595/g.1863  ORF Transcript_595/g.1863 Transcript_595/m.1863 type:complete len:390 (+) Transcript_595:156-1325(+)
MLLRVRHAEYVPSISVAQNRPLTAFLDSVCVAPGRRAAPTASSTFSLVAPGGKPPPALCRPQSPRGPPARERLRRPWQSIIAGRHRCCSIAGGGGGGGGVRLANQVRPVLLVEPRGPWQRPLPRQDPLDRSKGLLRPAARPALVAGPREVVVGEVDAPARVRRRHRVDVLSRRDSAQARLGWAGARRGGLYVHHRRGGRRQQRELVGGPDAKHNLSRRRLGGRVVASRGKGGAVVVHQSSVEGEEEGGVGGDSQRLAREVPHEGQVPLDLRVLEREGVDCLERRRPGGGLFASPPDRSVVISPHQWRVGVDRREGSLRQAELADPPRMVVDGVHLDILVHLGDRARLAGRAVGQDGRRQFRPSARAPVEHDGRRVEPLYRLARQVEEDG